MAVTIFLTQFNIACGIVGVLSLLVAAIIALYITWTDDFSSFPNDCFCNSSPGSKKKKRRTKRKKVQSEPLKTIQEEPEDESFYSSGVEVESVSEANPREGAKESFSSNVIEWLTAEPSCDHLKVSKKDIALPMPTSKSIETSPKPEKAKFPDPISKSTKELPLKSTKRSPLLEKEKTRLPDPNSKPVKELPSTSTERPPSVEKVKPANQLPEKPVKTIDSPTPEIKEIVKNDCGTPTRSEMDVDWEKSKGIESAIQRILDIRKRNTENYGPTKPLEFGKLKDEPLMQSDEEETHVKKMLKAFRKYETPPSTAAPSIPKKSIPQCNSAPQLRANDSSASSSASGKKQVTFGKVSEMVFNLELSRNENKSLENSGFTETTEQNLMDDLNSNESSQEIEELEINVLEGSRSSMSDFDLIGKDGVFCSSPIKLSPNVEFETSFDESNGGAVLSQLKEATSFANATTEELEEDEVFCLNGLWNDSDSRLSDRTKDSESSSTVVTSNCSSTTLWRSRIPVPIKRRSSTSPVTISKPSLTRKTPPSFDKILQRPTPKTRLCSRNHIIDRSR